MRRLIHNGGSNVTEVSDNGSSPSWAPDGKKIAFSSERAGSWDIYVMDADGSNVKRLTDSPSDEVDPSWSPDGNKIAFVSDRDGNEEIYVMNTDGTDQTNPSNNPADDKDPDWCCQSFQPTESTQSENTTQTPPSSERTLSQWVLAIFIISLVVVVAIFMGRKIFSRRK